MSCSSGERSTLGWSQVMPDSDLPENKYSSKTLKMKGQGAELLTTTALQRSLQRSLARGDKVTVSKDPTCPSSHFAFVQLADTYWFWLEGLDLVYPPPKDTHLCLWSSLLHRAYASQLRQCHLHLTGPGKPGLKPKLWCPGLLAGLLLSSVPCTPTAC